MQAGTRREEHGGNTRREHGNFEVGNAGGNTAGTQLANGNFEVDNAFGNSFHAR